MSNKDNNAYPIHPSVSSEAFHRNGLTKRELIAAMAMQGFTSNDAAISYYTDQGMDMKDLLKVVAEDAVLMADALLVALQ